MELFPRPLLDGYKNFMSGRYVEERERYRTLAEEGQKPQTLIIACCDSRAGPEMIFNARPGELFVVRNVANLVPPYQPDEHYHGTSAAVEFAVEGLKVKNIVVLGHGRCGGIHAALSPEAEPLSPGDFIGKWTSMLRPVAQQINSNEIMTPGERQTALERVSIRNSVNNLRSFPNIADAEKQGKLKVYGAWFDISTGELWVMDAKTGDFKRPE
ncbi:carbonic anhydrase [Martelella sp. HB161492]|uniref:carbonic anhydrase n=1 Tax=Martelella sp. HB161492 TaxID=2720726 RepID=UPI0015923FC9|nr:carbonic anhydrase [Martelella sp. HB161492]